MKIKFISITDTKSGLSPEDLIVYTARISSPSNQNNLDTGSKLLKYLIDHKHWSPFEMVDLTLEIETSRAIAAQILRHRSFCFQEFSLRYAQADLGFEVVEPREQDLKNRQNSTDTLSEDAKEWWTWAQNYVHHETETLYKKALNLGIAKECARFLLPLSATTRLYMKGSVRSWIHYIHTRTDSSTQKEHRDIAEACKIVFKQYFPVTTAAIGW